MNNSQLFEYPILEQTTGMIFESLELKNNIQAPTSNDYETLQLLANSISSNNELSSQNSSETRPLKIISKINSPSRHNK